MNTINKNELVITRIFNAPRTLVWNAWTYPEHFMRWWGDRKILLVRYAKWILELAENISTV